MVTQFFPTTMQIFPIEFIEVFGGMQIGNEKFAMRKECIGGIIEVFDDRQLARHVH